MGGYLPQVFERLGAGYPAVMEGFRSLAERLRPGQRAAEAVTRKGLRSFARRRGVDPSNLAKVLNRRQSPSREMLARIEGALDGEP